MAHQEVSYNSKLIEKLEDKIRQEELVPERRKQSALVAFMLDEGEEETNNSKRRGKQTSLRKFVGMDRWLSCDYMVVRKDKPVICIIEKTDLLESVRRIKQESHNYQSFRHSLEEAVSKNVRLGAKERADLISSTLGKFSDRIIAEELAEENKGKLYSSLYALCRLGNDPDFREISLEGISYTFILWVVPTEKSNDQYNAMAINSVISDETSYDAQDSHLSHPVRDKKIAARIKKISELLKEDINNKRNHSELGKAVKIHFGGIREGRQKFKGYLKGCADRCLRAAGRGDDGV